MVPSYKERSLGTPRTAEERVAEHYGIDISEARRWLTIHTESQLLPQKGTGLSRGTAAGVSQGITPIGTLLIVGLLGAVAVGVIGIAVLARNKVV